MPDLHERLTAAVNARLEVARALIVFEPYTATLSNSRSQALGDAVAAHLVANDPATVIRHCERDLKVLERHAPYQRPYGVEPRPIQCGACAELCHSRSGLGCDHPDAPYPCDEIRDLATAYGVEVDGG